MNKKGKLHPRSRHQGRYDFSRLIKADPALGAFVQMNPRGEQTIDFSDPLAVKTLNRALLKDCYGINAWVIPPQNLCPPIPGRADYIHYLADLLAESNKGVIPLSARVLDIGTGASCIYPLLGASEYGWHFVGSDVNEKSLNNAQTILEANPQLSQKIELRLQSNSNAIFNNLVLSDEYFDLSLCNPPFHASLAEANEGTKRKWKNLGKPTAVLNFGGAGAELWCEGGEPSFIARMITESAQISTQCFWFTTLVSKSSNLPRIYSELEKARVKTHKTITMTQGQKQSRFVAWTFLTEEQQEAWRQLRW